MFSNLIDPSFSLGQSMAMFENKETILIEMTIKIKKINKIK